MDNVKAEEKDDELPTGPIELPPDHTPPLQESVQAAEPAAVEEVVPVAVKPPVPESQLDILHHRFETFKENGVAWFKAHKFLGAIIILLMLGFLLYFWPLVTSLLIAQHMLKNTKGTANKEQVYKIVAIIFAISLSIQALWIVQLVQATAFP